MPKREPHVEVRHLRAFAMVAQELHFTRAAERMHLSQQALSAHIRHLEAELGVELFHRTTRTVELTPAGETLARYAAGLLSNLELAIRDTRRRAAGLDADLRIGHVPVIGKRAMASLATLAQAIPGLDLRTFEYWMDQAIGAVKDGRLDAALVTHAVHDPDLACVTVHREPLGVILGPSHPAAELPAVPVSALDGSTLAIVPREISPGFYDYVMTVFPIHAREHRLHLLKALTHELFLDDPVCRREITAGRMFFVMPEPDGAALPAWAQWRPTTSPITIDVDLVWRTPVRHESLKTLIDRITSRGGGATQQAGPQRIERRSQ